MADDEVLIANPTPAAVTVNAQTVPAGRVKQLTVDDTTTDLYAFVAKGCTVSPAAITNGTGAVANPIDNAVQLVEKGGRLIGSMARAMFSAAGDEHAATGL
jgi:hypothetical protein